MLARLAFGNVRKSLADFGIYFLTVMLGVAVFGHLDITSMALACAGAFLVVYGMYFVVTYVGACKLARE